jgi:cobalt/nickel transport system permease protein
LHSDLTDQYRHRDSLVHRLDPRVKAVATILYILAAGLVPAGSWWGFSGLLGLLLLAVLATRLGPLFTVRRSLLALPLVLAAVPLLFTTPGDVWFRLPLVGWGVTRAGAVQVVSILLRTWLAVQMAILLTATTRFPDLIWALGALRLPRPLVSTIAFMYRYLFVLADESLRMMRARASRSASLPGSRKPSVIWQARVAGGMVGSLFLRALERSERVYAAMLARGYDGSMRSLRRFRMSALDWGALGGIAVALGVVVFVGQMG